MNTQAARRCCLTLAVLLFSGGCATLPEPAGPEVLVTFELPERHAVGTSGSKRIYHAGTAWQVPLYTRQMIRTFARDHRLVIKDAWPIDALGVYCVSFQAPEPADPTALVDALSSDTRTQLVQLNAEFVGMADKRTVHHDDPLFDVQYGEFAGELEALHTITLGEMVRVGIIDGSVDLDHPDLSGQIASLVELVPAESPEARFHGTAVTGVIGAAAGNGEGLVGIAPDADIHVYAACNRVANSTVCTSLSIAKALTESLQEQMDIINMSFAGPEDPLITALIKLADEQGTILIAAGNPDDPGRQFPATHPSVYAPTRIPEPWFASLERMSTRAGGSYQVFFGTSIASAGMTGLAALVRAESSNQETRQVLDWLFLADCRRAPLPLVTSPLDLAQLCE